MAKITLQGNEINTIGEIPPVGANLDDIQAALTKTDLSDVTIKEFRGKKVVLNIFPSLDTGVCAASVRRFNSEAEKLNNTVVLCISKDLPFAHARFCTAEGLENVVSLSEMRDSRFSEGLGVKMVDGPLAGLFSRCVIVLNEGGVIKYSEQVPEIAQEPDYEKALEALRS